jgi:hypothetical protein
VINVSVVAGNVRRSSGIRLLVESELRRVSITVGSKRIIFLTLLLRSVGACGGVVVEALRY